MMTMQAALITSRDPKGLQFMSIVEAAYNKAKLGGAAAQLLNERGDELKAGVSELIAKLSVTDHFADVSKEAYRSASPSEITETAKRLAKELRRN